MHQLDIYVGQNCYGFNYAKALASNIEVLSPELEVRIFNLARPTIKKPQSVSVVPTYILNNSIICVGNPDIGELLETL